MQDIDPELLLACAAYLAHADAYVFEPGDSVLAMLRPIAEMVSDGDEPLSIEQADALTKMHLDRILNYVAGPLGHHEEPGVPKLRAVARAIIDSPDLDWWCRRLG